MWQLKIEYHCWKNPHLFVVLIRFQSLSHVFDCGGTLHGLPKWIKFRNHSLTIIPLYKFWCKILEMNRIRFMFFVFVLTLLLMKTTFQCTWQVIENTMWCDKKVLTPCDRHLYHLHVSIFMFTIFSIFSQLFYDR